MQLFVELTEHPGQNLAFIPKGNDVRAERQQTGQVMAPVFQFILGHPIASGCLPGPPSAGTSRCSTSCWLNWRSAAPSRPCSRRFPLSAKIGLDLPDEPEGIDGFRDESVATSDQSGFAVAPHRLGPVSATMSVASIAAILAQLSWRLQSRTVRGG